MKDLILGNKYFQPLFEFLFKVALKGMNYDRGHVPELSGEKYVLHWLNNKIKASPIILFDVGANKGQYAQLAYAILGSKANIFAFEPSSKAFEILERQNSLLKAYNLGMGASKQTAQVYYDEEGSVRASLYPKGYSHTNTHLDKSQSIQLITIDSFCIENHIQQIDFLKIDVEGHEIEVLKGANQMLAQGAIKYIQFEFGSLGVESRIFLKDFFTILKDYKIYRILQNGLRQIDYHEAHEIFLTTNYLAIRSA
jgi:FkbM family methyltransferase